MANYTEFQALVSTVNPNGKAPVLMKFSISHTYTYNFACLESINKTHLLSVISPYDSILKGLC